MLPSDPARPAQAPGAQPTTGLAARPTPRTPRLTHRRFHHLARAAALAVALTTLSGPASGAAPSDSVVVSPPGSPASPIRSAQVLGAVVTAEAGVPIPGVTVRVAELGLIRTTDARGRFDLVGLPDDAGSVSLIFERYGFAPLSRTVELSNAGTIQLHVEMERVVIGLDPIAVLLERTRMIGDPLTGQVVPGSAFFLSGRELESQKLAFANVHDVLRRVPGIHVQDEEGYGLRPNIGLRGTGVERSSNITLMEDGVLIAPAPYAAPAAYYFPTMGRMTGVEVRKGASQIRYGPRTLGGAINLLSAPIPDRRGWEIDLAGGDQAMQRGHARLGDSGDHFGWLLEGFGMRTDGFKELQGGGDTGFDTRDFVGKFRLNTDRTGPGYQELELKLGYTDHESDETYLGLTDADFALSPDLRYAGSQSDLMDTDHQQVQARYFYQPGQRTDVVVTGYRNEFARNWYKLQSVGGSSIASVLGDPEGNAEALGILKGLSSEDDALRVRANNREYLSQGVQTTFGLHLGEAGAISHQLEAGVRLHRDYEDRLQWEDGYRMEEGRMILTSPGAPGTQANRKAEASAVAVHVQDEIRTGAWSFVPGVRFESIDLTRTDWAGDDPDRTAAGQVRDSSVSAFIPGLGAAYEWSPWTTFFAGVHRGFAPPGPGASEDTDAEASINYELGARVRRAGVGANVTAFFSDYTNILGESTLATGGTGSGDLFNGGEVRVVGAEFAFDLDAAHYLELPVRLPVRLSYTYNEATFETSFESDFGPWGTVESGDELPYLPSHVASGSVGVEDPRWSVTLGWHASAEMRTEAGQGAIPDGSGIDGFGVLNLSAEWNFDANTSVYAAVQNLTDRRYVVARRPAGVRPGLPQTLFVGLRLHR